jgi:hypothetical protein
MGKNGINHSNTSNNENNNDAFPWKSMMSYKVTMEIYDVIGVAFLTKNDVRMYYTRNIRVSYMYTARSLYVWMKSSLFP